MSHQSATLSNIGITLDASTIGDGDKKLWEEYEVSKFIQRPSIKKFTPHCIFGQIKHHLLHMWKDEMRKVNDPWWESISSVEYFNKNQRKTVADSISDVFNKFMSAFCSRTTKKGEIPQLIFVERKPEPLGTEFKKATCGDTGIFIGIELQIGENDTSAPDREGLNTAAAVSTRLARLILKNGQVSSYILFLYYYIFNVDATH